MNERNWPFACLELVGVILTLAIFVRVMLGKAGPGDMVLLGAAVIVGLVGAALFYQQNKLEVAERERMKNLEHGERMAQLFNERERVLSERARQIEDPDRPIRRFLSRLLG